MHADSTARGRARPGVVLLHTRPGDSDHTDAEREWACDRQAAAGRLDKALEVARARGWVVADMKRDWNVIFPFETKGSAAK